MTKVVRVDKDDKKIALEDKKRAHEQGNLHRAFSVFIFNKQRELLIQKRSNHKKLWPGFWSNTVCSHPLPGESILQAAKRRLKEEFGFRTKLKMHYKFEYYAEYKDIGIEHELCYVLSGKYDGTVNPDKREIADYKWIDTQQLKKQIKKSPSEYTPWFKKELKELEKRKII